MKRKEAINLLAQNQLPFLSTIERRDIVASWWPLDQNDPEFAFLPDDLKRELISSDAPEVAISDIYDPLILVAICSQFVGVQNSYLEKSLLKIGVDTQIDDAPEELLACPCCNYKTLERRGAYDICIVCFWEDDGSGKLDSYSGANRMTLREGQRNFAEIGAMSQAALKHLPIDGNERYLIGSLNES